jgi:HK97 family phage portal protein
LKIRDILHRAGMAVQVFRNDISTSRELFELLRNGQTETESGAIVSPDTAMRVSTFYACIRVLAESLAQVPCILYKKIQDGKEPATDHPLYQILSVAPNSFQTSFEFFELMQVYLGLRGNTYALKTVVRNEVRELLPVSPDRVTVKQDPKWNVTYDVSMPDGTILQVPPERMFHVPGLGFNGLVGLSPLLYHKETLGVAIQLTRHTARLFKNGAHVGGTLEHPGKLSDVAYKRLKDSFDEQYAGVSNAHKTLMLEEGAKFNATGSLSSRDVQYIETRQFTRGEIASIFRIPPHMVGDLDRSTNNNIEQQALEFVTYTMAPWYRRFEQRIVMQLLSAKEQLLYEPSFRSQDLLRGDMKTRYMSYNLAILCGWMRRNEARTMEGFNKADGLDDFLQPVNMQDLETAMKQANEPDTGAPQPSKSPKPGENV